MRKILFLAFILTVCFFSAKAQIAQKLTQGSLVFLNEVKNLNIVFDYTDLIINGNTEEYFTVKSGEKWKNNWDNDKIRFNKLFIMNANMELIKKNAALRLGDFPDAEYIATVKVLKMIDGIHTYSAEVIFTQTGSTDVLAVVSIDNREDSLEWTLTKTINKIMTNGGKQFAQLIMKKIKHK